MLIGRAEVAAEVEDGVIIVEGEGIQKGFQFLETLADLRQIGFVGLGVGLAELIQNGAVVAVAGVEGMSFYVGF